MERNWKDIIFPRFEVRKSKKQKTEFIEMLRERYGERLRVEECGTLLKSRNIVIGDPEKAKAVYTAHYDTCAVLPFPNFITPRNFFVYLLYQIAISVLLLLPVAVLEYLFIRFSAGMNGFARMLLSEILLFGGLFLMIWLLMFGKANPHTANDNTSGVVTVLTLADRLADEKDAAFILFDNEEIGLLGSAGYANAHKHVKTGTLIVNFDCVSDGDHILMLFSKKAETEDGAYYARLRESAEAAFAARGGKQVEVCPKKGTFYPSDQANFRRSAAVCALKRSRLVGLYMNKIHTPRDTVFDEENVAAITEAFAAAHAASESDPAPSDGAE